MDQDISSFSKLKEIEKELDSLRSYKEHREQTKIIQNKDENTKVLESINVSCIRVERKLSEVLDTLKKLLNLFNAAIKGESPDKLENNEVLDKVDKLVEQNSELLARLDAMTQNIKSNIDYNTLNTNHSQGEGYYGGKI